MQRFTGLLGVALCGKKVRLAKNIAHQKLPNWQWMTQANPARTPDCLSKLLFFICSAHRNESSTQNLHNINIPDAGACFLQEMAWPIALFHLPAMPLNTRKETNIILLDSFYRIFFLLGSVFLLIGVPFVFYRKTVSAILCVILIAVVTVVWRMNRDGQPERSLKLFAPFMWVVLIGMMFFGLPPITVALSMAIAIMLCIVVSTRSGIVFVVTYMLGWLAYVLLDKWNLAPAPYFFNRPLLSWFIAGFSFWLVLLPVPNMVSRMRRLISLQRATIEATADGILVVASDGNVVTYNQRLIDMWGVSSETLDSAHADALLQIALEKMADPDQFVEKVRELNANPEMSSFDILKLKDGRIFERNSLPQRLDGKVVGRVWSLRDVTDAKNTEHALHQSRQLLDSIVENMPAMVFVKNAQDLRFEMFNRAGEAMLGYSRHDLIGKNDHDIFPENQAEFFIANDRRVLASNQVVEIAEEPIVTATGQTIYLHTRKIALRNDAGAITHLLGISLDITDRKLVEEELQIVATAFESQEAIIIADADNVILRVNRAFTDNTGYSLADVIGKATSLLQSGRHESGFYASIKHSLARDGSWQGEVWDRRKDGEIYPNWTTITAVTAVDGCVTHLVTTQTDITTRKMAEEKIRHLAFYDPLTLLPNRRLLMDRLRQALAAGARSGRDGALMFIDLDNFKILNDTLGHDNGDQLLRQVSERLPWCVRDGDTIARLGGDEFVVMLEELSADPQDAAIQAEAVGEKILAALGQPYQLVGQRYHCTPSIGVALFADHNNSIEEIMKRADLAMYQAKAAGRNCLRFFDPSMQAVVTAHATMEEELRNALNQKEFCVYYQPQVDNAGCLVGAEALVRWQHPVRGMVAPAEFIPLSEQTAIILPLGLWILETACRQLLEWGRQPETAHLTLAVNVSARQFRQPSFVEQVMRVLTLTGANPQRLKLELTESLLLDDVEDVVAKMTALKAEGVRLALDDFGTGYSSLSYLKRLPLDLLKIDRSFVRDVLTNPSDAAIARTIVTLGQSLGLKVIAEGVETIEQWDFLKEMGCQSYQGYLFGRPVPPAEFGNQPILVGF